MSKNLKVLGIGVLLIGLAVAGWFLYTVSQSQNGAELTQDNTENQKQEQGDVGINDEERRRIGGSDTEENKGEMEELQVEDIDTSNWKTYRSEICGIQFKYPREYYLSIFTESKYGCNILASKNRGSNPGENVLMQYTTTFTNKDSFLKCNIKKHDQDSDVTWMFTCGDNNGDIKKRSDYELYESLMNGNCDVPTIWIANEQKLLENNGSHEIILECETGDEDDAKVLRSVFKSFKFLNK